MESRASEMNTASGTALEITRSFAAPRPLVYDAFTKPELVREWLWAMECPMIVCDIDLSVGGKFRYVWAMRDGKEMGLTGRYQELAKPGRIVHTELFDEDWTGGETIVTTTLNESGFGTLVLMRIEYATAEVRDRVLKTNMADGIEEGYQKLDRLLSDRNPIT